MKLQVSKKAELFYFFGMGLAACAIESEVYKIAASVAYL
jgi:hypothetical protein